MRKRKKLGLLLMAVASAGVVAPNAQGAVIDNFDTPNNFLEQSVRDSHPGDGLFNNINTNSYSDVPSNIYGGTRKLFVDFQGTPGGAVSLTVNGSGLGFAFDENSPDSSPASPLGDTLAHITWDGTANLNALNTTNAWNFGTDAYFAIQTNPDNVVDTQISIEVWGTGALANNSVVNTYNLSDFSLPQVPMPVGGNAYFFAFSDFVGLNFAGGIGAIRLNFLTDNISINSFETFGGVPPVVTAPVPVPAAAGLGFLGMALVAAYRRKQGAKA